MKKENIYNNSEELLMYQVMTELSKLNIPLVFKGGLITKAYLTQENEVDCIRATKDIDANWIGKEITIEDLCAEINKALINIDQSLKAVPFRNFDDIRSAGIEVVNQNQETIFKLDIDVHRPVSDISFIKIDNIEIKCVDAKQIIADKICSLSSKTIFRRTKDLVDLYALSTYIPFNNKEIIEIAQKTNHEISDFDCFLYRKEDLKHAYNKLSGVYNKPDFEQVYDKLSRIVYSFLKERKNEIENVKNEIENVKEDYIYER